MTSITPRQWTFVRDAVVAIAFVSVAMGLYRLYVEPAFLRIPGMVLYVPLVVVYIALGGETENAMGPSTLQIALYVLVVGLVFAAVADRLRRRVDWD